MQTRTHGVLKIDGNAYACANPRSETSSTRWPCWKMGDHSLSCFQHMMTRGKRKAKVTPAITPLQMSNPPRPLFQVRYVWIQLTSLIIEFRKQGDIPSSSSPFTSTHLMPLISAKPKVDLRTSFCSPQAHLDHEKRKSMKHDTLELERL